MCLTTVFVLSVISTLVINWRIQFRDLLILVGIQPFFFFWIILVTLVTLAVLMIENKDRVLFLKMCAGGMCLS